jgi:trimethyllysine dioxygenase
MIDRIDAGDLLRISWSDGKTTEYPWIWVREHSHDPATFHPVTQQREVDTAALSTELSPTSVAADGTDVTVEWGPGEAASTLPVEFLARFRDRSDREPAGDRVVWDRETIEAEWPSVAYDDVMAGDDGVAAWLDRWTKYGFCMVTGTPATAAATKELVERVGYVRHTIFGGFWEFEPDLAKADTAYTDIALGFHTDGTYSHDAPGAQILHCLGHDGEGGESTMVDGLRIADELRRTAPEHYETLSTVEVPGQYIGDGAHLVARRPVFRHDSAGALVQVSFNNYDRAPFLLPPDEMGRFYDALRAFEALARDPRLHWVRRNPPGEAMLFDNWRVLHGRNAFTGRRHMCGAYVNREDVESRRRLVATARGG